MLESVNGLPAHPLFVHAPVVLVPLATLAALVVALRPGLARRGWWWVAGAAAIGFLTTQMAVSSGYRFDEVVGDAVDTSDHQALGEATRNLVAVFLVSSLVTAWLVHRRGDRQATDVDDDRGLRWAVRIGAVITTLSAIMSTIWMVRTGDEGARLVWDGVLTVARR